MFCNNRCIQVVLKAVLQYGQSGAAILVSTHWKRQSLWNTCLHGVCLTRVSFKKSSTQMQHEGSMSLLFFDSVPNLADFNCFWMISIFIFLATSLSRASSAASLYSGTLPWILKEAPNYWPIGDFPSLMAINHDPKFINTTTVNIITRTSWNVVILIDLS